jgi:hypothetical protein
MPDFASLGLPLPDAATSSNRPPLSHTGSSTSSPPPIPRTCSVPSGILQSRFNMPLGNSINITIPSGAGNITPVPGSIGGQFSQIQLQQPASLPPPPSPPAEPLRKPFFLMSMLLASINSKQGGFLTSNLYVPHDVWSQGGAKLTNISEKGKCVEVLNGALEDVVAGSGEFFRGVGRPNAEKWLKSLDEWTSVCDSVLSSVGKKLGVGESVTARKSGVSFQSKHLSTISIPNAFYIGNVLGWKVLAHVRQDH